MTAARSADEPGDEALALAAAFRDLADSQEATASSVRAVADSLGDPARAHRWAEELLERAAENRQNAANLEQGIRQPLG